MVAPSSTPVRVNELVPWDQASPSERAALRFENSRREFLGLPEIRTGFSPRYFRVRIDRSPQQTRNEYLRDSRVTSADRKRMVECRYAFKPSVSPDIPLCQEELDYFQSLRDIAEGNQQQPSVSNNVVANANNQSTAQHTGAV